MGNQLITNTKTQIMYAVTSLLVVSSFGNMMPAFGYDTLLDVQPASVDLGFRLFLTIHTTIGFLLAIFHWLYPLHGKRVQDIQAAVAAKKQLMGEQAA